MELGSDSILPQTQFQLTPVASSALRTSQFCHVSLHVSEESKEAQETEFHQGTQKILSAHYAVLHQQTLKINADECKTVSKD